MVNPEEVLQSLDEFSKLKPKDIPRELEDYLLYVAKTGDPVYQWSLVKYLFREKMLNVITDFYESCPTIDLPPCPNVDPFNYETMKANLLERLDSFSHAPFTVQRLCELLTKPRKEYTRVDKFMRAIEKNILVVSTKEPGGSRSRGDSTSQQNPQQSDVLMNGVMDGRGPGGLDIGEAIETVSADGVNLMHAAETVAETTEVALADTIRVECEDIDMEEDDGVAWHSKAADCRLNCAEGIKSLSDTPDSTATAAGATTVVWDRKVEECAVNGEGIKTMASSTDTVSAAVVWDTKVTECEGEGLKDLSVAAEPDSAVAASSNVDVPASSNIDVPAQISSTKSIEDEHDETAVAVVSEFLSPNREVFGQPVELGSSIDGVPLVLATGAEPEQTIEAVDVTASCSTEVHAQDSCSVAATEASPEIPEVAVPVEKSSEADNKDTPEAKESDAEDTSQVDAESGISCSPDTSPDTSASSDCAATAEMNQTLETNGSLEITSVESEVMSPLEALEDVTANISPPSPDQCANLDGNEATPPPTFSELTADEDTQDAVRSSEQLDDDEPEEGGDNEAKIEVSTLSELEPSVDAADRESSLEVEETPMEVETSEEEQTMEQTIAEEPPAEVCDSGSEAPVEDSDPMPYDVD